MNKNCNVELKKIYYGIFQKIFGFNAWHKIPIEARPYALYLVKKVNQLISEGNLKEEIVEVGCGMGDIISAINYPKKRKIGYDLDANIIRAARIVHWRENFCVGSFDAIKGHNISLLIAVNFLHSLNEKQVQQMFSCAIRENNISRIIVDEVESPPYEFSHSFQEIFCGAGFQLKWRSRSFAAMDWSRRRLLLFEKNG